jgi:hypothetical protein
MVNIGIDLRGAVGIGDKVQFSCIPEAFYKWYNIKLVDYHRCWVFDKNPYVRRLVRKEDLPPVQFECKETGEKIKGFPVIYCNAHDWVEPIEKPTPKKTTKIINLWQPKDQIGCYSRSRWFYKTLGIQDWNRPELCIPRGPRLYKYEDPLKVKQNQITIHVGPSANSKNQFIPPEVLSTIAERYANYNIIQIGSKSDNDSPFTDKRGLEIWDTIKTIAESAIFIGINSGPMNIANCYPHINKKIIMREANEPPRFNAAKFDPLSDAFSEFNTWVDFGLQYFNTLKYDIGRTYSYTRI